MRKITLIIMVIAICFITTVPCFAGSDGEHIFASGEETHYYVTLTWTNQSYEYYAITREKWHTVGNTDSFESSLLYSGSSSAYSNPELNYSKFNNIAWYTMSSRLASDNYFTNSRTCQIPSSITNKISSTAASGYYRAYHSYKYYKNVYACTKIGLDGTTGSKTVTINKMIYDTAPAVVVRLSN